MTRLILLVSILLLVYACKKDNENPPPEPTMEYLDLKNAEVKDGLFQRVDVGEINSTDFTFTTRVVTDPTLNQTKFQFLVTCRLDSYVMLVTGTQTGKKFMKGDSIRMVAAPGSTWTAFSIMHMAEKVTPAAGATYWQGEWKDASRHFLPIKVTMKSGKVHTGWIELSMDITNEKMILHKAAISLEPDKNVRAGD